VTATKKEKCTHTEDSSLWKGEGLCDLQPLSNLLADVRQAQQSARLPRPRPLKEQFHKIFISSNPHFFLRMLNFELCDVQNFDNQVNIVVGAHMKEYRKKWQTTAGQCKLG
jgi:hypothetical protein